MEKEGTTLGPSDDLLAIAERALEKKSSSVTPSEKAMSSFAEHIRITPSWVDEDQLKRGQEVFLAYTPIASLALYYRSLVAGFSIPKIAAVARSTAYLTPPSRPDQVLQRLLDTGELTASCIGLGVESLLPGGTGWKVALHVRFLHAKVRRALLKRKGKQQWDTARFGIPINQEDMAATLLAFSVNVLHGIEFIAGVKLSEQEQTDYLALWRYIGFLLGVETKFDDRMSEEPSTSELAPLDPCGPGNGTVPNSILNARSLLSSMIFHLLDPDETSVEIAHHLLKVSDRTPPSRKLQDIPEHFYKNDLFYFRCLQCRRFIGDPLADALNLPLHPNRWTRAKLYLKSTVLLLSIRVYTLTAMFIPFLRRRMVGMHARAFLRFHDHWTMTHKTKMAKAFHEGEKPSCAPEGGENKKAEISTKEMNSICPFAMIAPPTS